MRHAIIAGLFAVIATATPLLAQPAAKPGEEAEREALRHALSTACQEFPREDQWQQADACRRAFFTAHEEAIWRLNLNPHNPLPQPPS